jgi:hypothetical protein
MLASNDATKEDDLYSLYWRPIKPRLLGAGSKKWERERGVGASIFKNFRERGVGASIFKKFRERERSGSVFYIIHKKYIF